VISRVADNCLWFGRYLERAESTARLLAATRELAFDADLTALECWRPLVIVSGEAPAFVDRHGEQALGDGEQVQAYMTWDERNGVSLRSSVRAAREIGRTVRETLSLEVWEEINELHLWLTGETGRAAYDGQRETFYRHVRRSTQVALGLVRSTMLHDEPMRFLWLGVMLERVGQIARILDMHHHTLTATTGIAPATASARPPEGPPRVAELDLWLWLLRACSGFEAFMKRQRGRVARAPLVSFLVFEADFPRSLRYGLRSALELAGRLWPDRAAGPGEAATRLAATSDWLDAQQAGIDRADIHELLTTVVDRTAEVCLALQQAVMGPPVPPATGTLAAQ
jgi:uncharacterized alpha-E superfamily protein